MTTTLLAAGDHFVLPALLVDAVRDEVGHGGTGSGWEFRELTLGWPHVPFGPVAEVTEAAGSESVMIDALRDARICVTQLGPLTETILRACADLELFCVSRGGPVNANLEAATEHGVVVCYAPGRNAAATAEHTLGVILAAARHLPQMHAELRAGSWRGDYYAYDNCGLEIEGETVGLVGLGAIGSRVARALGALGARVLVHDPYVDRETVTGVDEWVELDELLARSRIVSVHARATDETTNLIGRARIEAMPAGSVLVNCARGALVDYEAVCDALETGHLLGAGFDVFPEEPLAAESRLLTAPNVVITPHVAGASKQTAHKAAGIVAGEVGRYVRGEPLRYCANPEVLSRRGMAL